MTEVRHVQPSNDPSGLHVGVVAARWNSNITHKLVGGAVAHLEEVGVGKVTVLRVPGSLELPIGARTLIESGCQAVVALGVIIRGDTDHYYIVKDEASRGLTMLADRTGCPVTNGILAVHDIGDAIDRAGAGESNKGHEAAAAAVETLLALEAMPSK